MLHNERQNHRKDYLKPPAISYWQDFLYLMVFFHIDEDIFVLPSDMTNYLIGLTVAPCLTEDNAIGTSTQVECSRPCTGEGVSSGVRSFLNLQKK